MIQRKEVVLSVLGKLQDATECTGLEALTQVAMEVEQVLSPFLLPTDACKELTSWMGIDSVAHTLYPADAPVGLLPLACKGEGNLLFDAASMLLVGSTSLSLELQVRTVVEMLLWKRYYLSGMIDSKVMLQAARFSLCAEESEDMLNLPMAVLEAIFDADVKASCFPGSFANMWHIYALSSVVQCNIYSVYPMYNLKIRPYFNRLIRPRVWPKDTELETIHIMWSGELEDAAVFKPHNFVALLKACDLNIGTPNSEQRALPIKTLELLNQDSRLSYSSLKDKFNITKSTFYRWRRQTQEHRQKSAARYEAKHFFQACYLEGKLIPLPQFKEFFPEISRSTYYAWKHELMSSGGHLSGGSAGEVSPGESTEPESWSSPEGKHSDPQDITSYFTFNADNLEGERAQNLTLMQEAKKCLQNCIAMNTSFPYRIFKRSFPGISRSTYYNWRREAMRFNPGYKDAIGSSEDSSDGDKSQRLNGELFPVQPASHRQAPRVKIWRHKHKIFQVAHLRNKKLREQAKAYAQKSKITFSKFKAMFPSISTSFYWFWRNRSNQQEQVMDNPQVKAAESMVLVRDAPQKQMASPPVSLLEGNPKLLAHETVSPYKVTLPAYPVPHKTPEDQMFVMDVVALANFKAKAKLFLQQRFEEKSFPTFKEFRSYFPLTPRSTYYMWKRALHHGVPLVHG
ncbi:vertnin [Alosa sapidissima]|uniref:vertnin n=1 Tax=Alosa sapidissima TaxID=34773 RepID=UPI001C09BD01|nr:vertnin [Alosa sapidissima]XP_041952373.1 vertnin [Alosa sapidissima]